MSIIGRQPNARVGNNIVAERRISAGKGDDRAAVSFANDGTGIGRARLRADLCDRLEVS
jgi:hypothetical protein